MTREELEPAATAASEPAEVSQAPQRPTVPTPLLGKASCVVCGAALTVHQEASGRICSAACLHKKGAMDVRGRHATAARQAAGLRQALAARLGAAASEPVESTVVPVNRDRLSPLPVNRVERFRTSLQAAVDEALAPDTPAASDRAASLGSARSPEHLGLLAQGCATCRGWCCKLGGDHAFLTAAQVRKQLDRTGMSGDELRDSYLVYADGETFERGCIFQGPGGCKLPREKRADVCNEYHCAGLEQVSATASIVVFAASDGQRIERLAVVNTKGERLEVQPPD